MTAEQLAADVLAATLAVIVAGFPLGYWTRRTRPARHADRALLRLARRKDHPPVKPTAQLAATEDEQRDPDYCWTCGRKCGSKAHR